MAYEAGRRALPEYAHRFSPKKFTQHQLLACLVLKEFMRIDYRGLAALLADCPELRAAIHLQRVPHFTTLQKAADRLLTSRPANRLLDETVALARKARLLRRRVKLAAVDSSGFESHHASRYFVRRRAKGGNTSGKWQRTTYRRFPKLTLLCDCATHIILAAVRWCLSSCALLISGSPWNGRIARNCGAA